MDQALTNSLPYQPQVLMLIRDPILDRLYRSQLEIPGFCTVWCDPTHTWKPSLQAFRYDVVVFDFSYFKDQDPLQALSDAMSWARSSKFIVLSDSDDARLAIQAFRLGVADYFLKPTDPLKLRLTIERVVGTHQLESPVDSLNADFDLFHLIHQLNATETAEHLHALIGRSLITLLNAEGGSWVTVKDENQSATHLGNNIHTDATALKQYQIERKINLVDTFSSNLTTHPENWIQGSYLWIPLRESWMGGVFVHGISVHIHPTLESRIEFLVRHVEHALEHRRRFVDARKLSFVDDVTRLFNCRYLEIAAGTAIERFEKRGTGFSVLFIDIDRFKMVNDDNGHLTGSQLLVDLANILRITIPKPDLLFRYGGDEFIALLYGSTLEQAIETAERLRQEVEDHKFFVGKKSFSITLSIGVARVPEHARDVKSLISMADDAMYNSKKSGRNKVFVANKK